MTLISDAIKEDHRELESCYDQIINSPDADTQIRFRNQFTWELARHSVGEELVVYPAFEKYLKDGKEIADKDRAEHQIAIEKLKKFESMKPSNPEFIPTIKSLMDDLSQHIKEEETHDFPALEEAMSASESEKLATTFSRTKMFVPSRAHPTAPRKPPFETALGLLTAPIDRIGDIFRKFPKETISPNPSTE
ncbi:hypothetical protein H2201_009148 [Coniosporium apollinis]|uniref:Hemerythrin-like domain-containing protein n=1 Tax=Coniosporium apollinis TaxID=61459 RepID=A0ABQ9NGX9_9PEZI|nr:hypothetical protein H2201_009148 [Coniosporium apollinis]